MRRPNLFFLILFLGMLVGGGVAQISRDEIIRTTDDDDNATHTTGTVTGGADKTFVLIIHLQGNDDVTAVSGGSLSWTERVDGCVDSGNGAHIYTAQGDASSFTVGVTFSSVTAAVVTHVITYSGVETVSGFEDAHWENPLGEGTANPGSCATSDKGSPATFTIGNTDQDSWFVIAVNLRGSTVTGGDSGLNNEIYDTSGDGGSKIGVHSYDLDRTTNTGDVAYSFTLSGDDDWVVGGIVMKELAAADGGGRKGQFISIGTEAQWYYSQVDVSGFTLTIPDTTLSGPDTLDLKDYVAGDTTGGIGWTFVNAGDSISIDLLGIDTTQASLQSGDQLHYDISPEGNMIHSYGRVHRKGLSFMAGANVSFDVSTGYDSLTAMLGHNGDYGNGDGFDVRIYVDGSLSYTSDTLYAWTPPEAISINVSGADSLRFNARSLGNTTGDAVSIINPVLHDTTTDWRASLNPGLSATGVFTINTDKQSLDNIIIVKAVANAVTVLDTFIVHSLATYDSLLVTVNAAQAHEHFPVRVKVTKQTGMRDDFQDVLFTKHTGLSRSPGDTLMSYLEEIVADSAWFWIADDWRSSPDDSIYARYNWSYSTIREKHPAPYWTFYFLQSKWGIPAIARSVHYNPIFDGSESSNYSNVVERGWVEYSVQDTAWYMFLSASDTYDQTIVDGNEIYRMKSTDNCDTWTDTTRITSGHWGEDVAITYFNGKWRMLSEDESRIAGQPAETEIILWTADSLDGAWAYVDTVLSPNLFSFPSYAQTETATPTIFVEDDTLWTFYEAITSGGSDVGRQARAYSINGTVWTNDTSNNPLVTHVAGSDYAVAGFNRIEKLGGVYHTFITHMENDRDGNWVLAHYYSLDKINWILDPDTTKLYASPNSAFDRTGGIILDIDDGLEGWTYDIQRSPKALHRDYLRSLTNWQESEAYTEFQLDETYGLWMNYTNANDWYITNEIRDVGTDGWVCEFAARYVGGDFTAAEIYNTDAELLFRINITTTNGKWRIQNGASNVTFPASDGISGNTYWFRLECTSGAALTAYAKANYSDNWTSLGSVGTTNDPIAPTEIKFGTEYNETGEMYIPSFKFYPLVGTEPVATQQ